jgi:hypothetical protein
MPSRRFPAIRNEPGNLCLRETAWWRSQSQSNLSLPTNFLITGKNTGKTGEMFTKNNAASSSNAAFMGIFGDVPYRK